MVWGSLFNPKNWVTRHVGTLTLLNRSCWYNIDHILHMYSLVFLRRKDQEPKAKDFFCWSWHVYYLCAFLCVLYTKAAHCVALVHIIFITCYNKSLITELIYFKALYTMWRIKQCFQRFAHTNKTNLCVSISGFCKFSGGSQLESGFTECKVAKRQSIFQVCWLASLYRRRP